MNNAQLTTKVTAHEERLAALEGSSTPSVEGGDLEGLTLRVTSLEETVKYLTDLLSPKCHFCGQATTNRLRITQGGVYVDAYCCTSCTSRAA